LAIAYYNQEQSMLEGDSGKTNLELYGTDLLFRSNDTWSFGFGHRSMILNVDRLELQNVTSDPDEFSVDAMQVLAAAVWNKQMSDRMALYYGICGDHRFGDYRVYPVINVAWQIHPDWLLELGFPTSQLIYKVSESFTSLLRISPNGNEWYVKDKSLTKHSQLVYEAYLLEWALNWRAHKNLVLTASVGRELDSRYEMTLRDENRVRLSSDSATRVGIALAWYF
jgi:hypothetical protein